MRKKPSLGAIFLTVFLDLLGFGLVIPFLPKEARDNFHSTAAMGTLIGSIYSLMQFLFVPAWGALSDRIGRRPVLVWSVFASAVTMAGLGLALAYGSSIGWLFVARGLSGIATANLGTASAYIADITTHKDRARGMGLIGLAFGLGFIIGPGVGGMLARITIHGHTGAVACFVAATLSAINFVWVLLGLPESLPKKRAKLGSEAVELPEEGTPRAPRSISSISRERAKIAFSYPGVARAILVNFIFIAAFTNLEQIFALFAHDEFNLDQFASGLVLMFTGIVAAGVQGGLIRPLTHRYAEPPLIRLSLALQSMAFLFFALSPSIGHWFLYLASGILAVGNGITQPTVSAFVSKSASIHEQGAVLGTNQSASSLGRVVGPLLAGGIYETFGHRAPFLWAALGMAIACFIALGISRSSPPVPGKEVPSR